MRYAFPHCRPRSFGVSPSRDPGRGCPSSTMRPWPGSGPGTPTRCGPVYRAYGGLVFAVAHRVLGDRSLAEEASQQAFLQAWRAARSFDPTRDLGPWLATIARRAAIDVHRRESVRAHGSIEELADRVPGGPGRRRRVGAGLRAVGGSVGDRRPPSGGA